jgi:iron complex transport system substrate-binding protein
MTAGKQTFIDDLVALAGGSNLGATAGSGYPTFSKETLITADPAVYIAVSGAQSTPGNIVKRAGYGGLSAVKNDRLYIIEDDLVTRSGPRLAEGLRQLAAMIHPEAYQEQ